MRIEFPDLRQRLNAVHYRHLYIQQNYIRVYMFEQVKELHAIVCFGHQFHIFLSHQGGPDACAEKRMVICDSYLYRPVHFKIFHTVIVSLGNHYGVSLLLNCKNSVTNTIVNVRKIFFSEYTDTMPKEKVY